MTTNFAAAFSSNRLRELVDCFARRGWLAVYLSWDVIVVRQNETELVIAFHRRYPGSLSVRGRILCESRLIDDILLALDEFPFGYKASWDNPDGTSTERLVEKMAAMDGPWPYERE
jgi:hypothetical protein